MQDHQYLSFPICHTVPMSQGVCSSSNWAWLMTGTQFASWTACLLPCGPDLKGGAPSGGSSSVC